MFYIETKDGDRFFTSVNSNDKEEFDKIIDQKLGRQASDLFNQLLADAQEEGYQSGITDGESSAEQDAAIDLYNEEQKRDQAVIRITDVIEDLNRILEAATVDKSDISACINELETINRDLE